MRLIDFLVEADAVSARAEATLPEGHLAVADGRVLEAGLVEMMAQTVAAMKAFGVGAGDAGAPGMLAGVAGFRVFQRPPAGRLLEIEVREEKQLGPMSLVSGRIICEGVTAAEGQIKLYK
jgi:predicted hotdog family 3-hydroxylacyl-ACP dehydratase